MTAIAWMGLAILATAIGAEFVAWSRPAQRWLLRRAAAPQGWHADRYYEEWLAELEEVPDGPVTRSLWALRLYLGRRELASALGVPRPSRTASTVFKRALDVTLTGLFLIMTAPVLVAISIAIRATSPGPVLARYQLVDIDTGRKITILRFRTRYADAEARHAALLAELLAADNEDDRSRVGKELDALPDGVTPVGRVLRRADLHEIPGLINVLRGDL